MPLHSAQVQPVYRKVLFIYLCSAPQDVQAIVQGVIVGAMIVSAYWGMAFCGQLRACTAKDFYGAGIFNFIWACELPYILQDCAVG